MVECTGLENRHRFTPIVGSNPPLAAFGICMASEAALIVAESALFCGVFAVSALTGDDPKTAERADFGRYSAECLSGQFEQ